MKNRILKILILTSCFAGEKAIADNSSIDVSNLSYTYAGARFFNQKLDNFNCDQDGINLYGSLDIQDGWFAEGSYTDVSGDRCGGVSNIAANVGYYTPFNTTFNVYGTLGLERISPDIGNGDSGIVVSGGFRGFLTEQFEVKIELANRTTYSGSTGITGSTVYWFAPRISATFDLGLSSDVTTTSIGARMNF